MSFLTGLALLIGTLIAIPVVAHLLRRGQVREQAFVPVDLVLLARTTARQRSRLDDKLLLFLRSLLILALAVLGAMPLVKCSRLSLARDAGASVALSIVIDDSLSMRAQTSSGKTRFELAQEAAREIMAASRQGDAISIVLAGSPARLFLAATTELDTAKITLEQVVPSDRPTDLETAVELGRASIKHLAHADKRVLVLSDFAASPPKPGEPPVWVALPELQEPIDNCGIVTAAKSALTVEATVACTSEQAARGRTIMVAASAGSESNPESGDVLGREPLREQSGSSQISLKLSADREGLNVYLEGGKDAITQDDVAPVTRGGPALRITAVVDRAVSSVVTGGATIIEQALSSLDRQLLVRPISIVPERAQDLEGTDLLILDDPIAFTPEMRSVIAGWLANGKVAVSFFGPRMQNASLGSNFEPFFTGAASWEQALKKPELDSNSLSWLGDSADSLRLLEPKGRALFSLGPEAQVLARWGSGEAFVFQTKVGRGSALSIGLPGSVDESDFALRPGFVALLDHFAEVALQRAGPSVSAVGASWRFESDQEPSVVGPGGALTARAAPGKEHAVWLFDPPLRGRYRVTRGGQAAERIATISSDEVLQRPVPFQDTSGEKKSLAQQPLLEISSEVALVALFLFLLELLVRAVRRLRFSLDPAK